MTSGLSGRVVKALGLFSGTQMLTILCSVVRTKFVALWIGTLGVGVFGILNSLIEMICTLSRLGLDTSTVRDISKAAYSDDRDRLTYIVTIVRRWGWILGIAGALLMVIAAPWLSDYSFSNQSYKYGIMALASIVLLNSITSAERSILQGISRLKMIAIASLIGVIAALIVSVPMIYVWKMDSIVPVLIVYAACNFVAMLLIARKYSVPGKERIGFKATLQSGSEFVKLGSYLTLGVFVGWVANYFFMSWLNRTAGSDILGCYQSGYTIAIRYSGIIFTAVGMEYFPRISGLSGAQYKRMELFMWHEASMLLRVIIPAAIALVFLAPLMIHLLYSREFMSASSMVILAAPGLILRGTSWCIAYTMIARGDGKVYFISELLSGVTGVVLNIIGYTYLGMNGIGISFTIWYLMYTLMVWAIARYRYGMKMRAGYRIISYTLAGAACVCVLGYLALGLK